jgi:GNAT superfamily N-acetyltransferase
MADDNMTGVAALRGGRLAGYLLGAPVLGSPTDIWAGFLQPRSAFIALAGWAADPADSQNLCHVMYAAVAERWVANGIAAHYITLPAHAVEPWLDLGFARYIVFGLRETRFETGRTGAEGSDFEFRRARPDDLTAVQVLTDEMFRAWSSSPVFMPYLPETEAHRRQFMSDLLADERCPLWLACVEGRRIGMQVFVEPQSSHWFLSSLQVPDKTVYLYLASTHPEARGRGVGTALFSAGMSWAREAEYDHCAVHYHTANRAAAFWRGLGFRTVSRWRCRVIDQRRTWSGNSS